MQDYTPTILVVDDEDNCLKVIKDVFELEGIECITANNGSKALELFDRYDVDIVISDIKMPGLSGLELLKHIKTKRPETFVIMLTGYGSIKDAIESIKHGAYHYVIKPIIMEDFLVQIKEITEKIRSGNFSSHIFMDYLLTNEKLIGKSKIIQNLSEYINLLSTSDLPLLIYGESGSGKELAAYTIHNLSKRHGHEFIYINCASWFETTLENELFGSKQHDKKNIIEKAQNGTLYLDEISNMKPAVQLKLLEILNSGVFKTSDSPSQKINIRFIAATSNNLKESVSRNEFNSELFQTLNVVNLQMPVLREIKSDIPVFATFYINEFASRFGLGKIKISDEAMSMLQNYNWPGNIRELLNIIRTAVSVCENNEIQIYDLPSQLAEESVQEEPKTPESPRTLLLADVEQEHILNVLKVANGNKSMAAQMLGIHRDTLLRKLKKYGVD
ncbi:sigma-54-dependent Fis family transcriptional regulator [candidate division KSB1 bacterium]|nr:sigma-54-dependent Fis family transcriptional regulator [candidate division KSB1 bacterium]